MSFFDALADCDEQDGHGWSSSSRFGKNESPDDIVCLSPPPIISTTACKEMSISASANQTSEHNQHQKHQTKNPEVIAKFSLEKVRRLICADRINSEVTEARNVQVKCTSQKDIATFSKNSPQTNNNGYVTIPNARIPQDVRIVENDSTSNSVKVVRSPPIPVSVANIKNMLVKATIPSRWVLSDNDKSSHDQLPMNSIVDLPDSGEQVIISSSSMDSLEEPEGFDDLINRADMQEAARVVVVKTLETGAQEIILEDGQKYTLVRENLESPRHSLAKLADGRKLKALLISPSDSRGNLSGGGKNNNNNKSQLVKGTPNHVTASSSSSVGSASTSSGTPSEKKLMNSRFWNYAEKLTGPLIRPPLHTSSSAQKSNADEDGAVLLPTKDKDMKLKEQRLADDPKLVIVCGNCGNLTRNVRFCGYCSRAIPPKPTYHTPVKSAKISGSQSSNSSDKTSDQSSAQKKSILDKSTFYGNKLKEQSQHYDNLMKDDATSQPKRKIARSTRGSNAKRPLKRYIYTETVTISSDEDEKPQADKSLNESQVASESSPSPSTSHESSLSMPTVGDSPSPSPAPVAAQTTCKVLSRKERMQDKDGKRIVKKKQEPLPDEGQECKRVVKKKQEPLPDVSRIDVEARGIRIGSMKGVPYKPVLVSVKAIHIDCETTDETVSLEISSQDLLGCHAHLSPNMPTLFLYVTPGCGKKIREKCRMTEDGQFYFDPTSDNDFYKRIVVLFKSMTPQNAKIIESILTQMAKAKSETEDASSFFEEISFTETNKILVYLSEQYKKMTGLQRGKSSSKPLQAPDVSSSSTDCHVPMETDEPKDERPPELEEYHPGFTGEVEKLIVYPPPPSTGAITVTNEDLFCLNEGEFLNDVIIDFYLKYLVYNELSEDEHGKTHIFNSFFYKRLTLKQSRYSSLADDVTLTLPLKRHTRVKTWTRHVDIFSKDFVIVPINEHAHWFLAIICFPGLKEPKFEKALHPKTKNEISIQKQTCILVMDSLAGPSRQSVVRILRDYLQVEWDTKKKETDGARVFNRNSVRGSTVRVPQQNNYSDCGVFILHYAESFFKDPIPDYTFPLSLQQWFPVEEVTQKRDDIRDLVLRLKAEQDANKNS